MYASPNMVVSHLTSELCCATSGQSMTAERQRTKTRVSDSDSGTYTIAIPEAPTLNTHPCNELNGSTYMLLHHVRLKLDHVLLPILDSLSIKLELATCIAALSTGMCEVFHCGLRSLEQRHIEQNCLFVMKQLTAHHIPKSSTKIVDQLPAQQ